VPRGNTRIEVGDHLIVILLPDALAIAEKLSG
jgi:Trk K+ transport system NAD-binding subunit